MKLRSHLVLPLTLLAVASGARAQCGSTTVDGTVITEYDPGINTYLPWQLQVTQAVLRMCPEARIAFFGQSLSVNLSQGNSTSTVGVYVGGAGAIQTVANSILTGNPPAPSVSFGNCPWFTNEEALLETRGNVNLYSFHVGGGYFKQRARGTFQACDRVRVTSPVATTIEVPVHVQGSVLAAESFGDQPFTVARAELSLTGTVDGQGLPALSASTESVSVIPEQDAVSQDVFLLVAVSAGTTIFEYDLTGDWSAEANAKGTGLFGTIAGSATAGIDFPNTIRVGNFRGVGGAPLPAGIVIESDLDGRVYTANTSGAPLCAAATNSSGMPASLTASGSPFLSDASLTLRAEDCPAGEFGLFAFGGAEQPPVATGNGFFCVAPGGVGLQRLPVELSDPAGVLEHVVDLGASPADQVVAGTTYVFQGWFRDPSAGGAGFNFSDAVSVHFLP